VDQQIEELIFQIRSMIEPLRRLSEPGAGSRTNGPDRAATAFERSSERIVQALARLGSEISRDSTTRAQRDRQIQDFVKAVDQATDSAQAQSEAATERVRSEQEAAQAARDRAAVDEEVAQRAAWTQKQRDDYDRAMLEKAVETRLSAAQELAKSDLYRMGRDRDWAQELAEARIREKQQADRFREALGSTAGFLSRRFNTDLVRTNQTLLQLGTFARTAGTEMGNIGKSVLSLGKDVSQGFNSFTQFNGVVDAVTGAISKMGASIPFLGAAMVAAAEGAKFLLNQLQNSAQAFNTLAQSGALTADGMDGVYNQFLQSGMTLEAFQRQVTGNSQALARLGGSVGEGTKRFTELTGGIIDSNLGQELRRIGMSSEQIGATAASFLTQQARLGRAQRMTQDQLTAGTMKYARELDQISRLTGLQREDLQKRLDAALSEQRFRAKMNELERSGRGDVAQQLNMFQAAVGESAPGLAQGLRDIIAAGGAVTTEAAEQAFRLTGGQIVGIAQRALSGEDVGASLQSLAQSVSTGVKNFETVAKFADVSPIIGDFAQASDFASKGLNDFGKTLDRIRGEQAAGIEAPTKLTEATVTAQQEMEQLSRNINQFGMLALPAASQAVSAFSTTLNDAIKEISERLGIELPTVGKGGTAGAAAGAGKEGPIETAAGYAGTAAGAYGGAKAGMAVGTLFGPVGTAVGAVVGGVVGGVAGYMGARQLARGETPKPSGKPPEEVPGDQPMSGLPPGKQLTDVLSFTAPSGTQQAFMGLNDRLRQRVIQAAVEYNQATGDRLQINSALRSRQDQERLYQESVAAGRPGRGPTGMPIARPGTSPHEQGLAVDIQNYQNPQALAALNRAGLYNRVAGDPVHFHMARGGIARGPDTGYPATLHGVEAVVPLPDGRSIPVDIKDGIERMRETMMQSSVVDTRPISSELRLGMRQLRETLISARDLRSPQSDITLDSPDLMRGVTAIARNLDHYRDIGRDISLDINRFSGMTRELMGDRLTSDTLSQALDRIMDPIARGFAREPQIDTGPMMATFDAMKQSMDLLRTDGARFAQRPTDIRIEAPDPAPVDSYLDRLSGQIQRFATQMRAPIPVETDDITDQLQAMITGVITDTGVDFREISRRNDTDARRRLDSGYQQLLPEIREVLRDMRNTADTEDVDRPNDTATQTASNQDLARQIGRELGSVIENTARQQISIDSMNLQLMEQLVQLQSRSNAATERLLRASTS